jgi:hypothetical protein
VAFFVNVLDPTAASVAAEEYYHFHIGVFFDDGSNLFEFFSFVFR